MGKLRDLHKKLSRVTVKQQEKDLLKIMKANEAYAVDLNIEQMMSGKDSNGNDISPPYTALTVEIKKEKGQPYDRVTLHDEGLFQRRMYEDTGIWPVTFSSTDAKAAKLIEKYGDEIFGLDRKNLSLLSEQIKPEVVEYYRNLFRV